MIMKNLKNSAIQELNPQEIKKINGGWLWVPGVIADAVNTYYELKSTAERIINHN